MFAIQTFLPRSILNATLVVSSLFLITSINPVYADNKIELSGAVLNTGAAIGAGFNSTNDDAGLTLEVSVGTNPTRNGNSLSNDITVGNIFGVSIVNAAISWQGTACAKVAIGSIGATPCGGGN